MSCKNDMRTQIVARLSGAHFPIRDPEALVEALGTTEPEALDLGETYLDVDEIVKMLSPRDYLFTSPWQVADLLEWRADAPSHTATAH